MHFKGFFNFSVDYSPARISSNMYFVALHSAVCNPLANMSAFPFLGDGRGREDILNIVNRDRFTKICDTTRD